MTAIKNKLTLSDLTEEQKMAAERYVQWGIRKITNCQPIDEERAREFGRKLMAVHRRRCRKVVIVQSPSRILPGKSKKFICHALQYCRDFMTRRVINHLTFPLRFVLFSRNESEFGHYDFIKKRPPPLSYSGDLPREGILGTSSSGISIYTGAGYKILWDLLQIIADCDLWKWLCGAIIDPVRKCVPDIICENCDTKTFSKSVSLNGQIAAPQAAAAKYIREVCAVEMNAAWELEEQVEFDGVYMYRDHIVICQRPSHIEPTFGGRLHRDGGGFIEYSDGFGFYALNNVIVPEWLAVGKAEDIDPALFATIDNVEIRREFLRKVGIERIHQKLDGRIIDRRGDYELVKINLGGRVGMWPYLKMKNPSIGVWHLEAVPKRTFTVDMALRWRNGTVLPPSRLT